MPSHFEPMVTVPLIENALEISRQLSQEYRTFAVRLASAVN